MGHAGRSRWHEGDRALTFEEPSVETQGRLMDEPKTKLNLGCGALVGLLIGFSLALNIDDVSAVRPLILITTASVGSGLMAFKFGHRFWAAVAIFFGWP